MKKFGFYLRADLKRLLVVLRIVTGLPRTMWESIRNAEIVFETEKVRKNNFDCKP